jgi:NADH dehydrogenase FAD-containing subunit
MNSNKASGSREQRRIVIVGGGYAGIQTLNELSKKKYKNFDIEIVLISQTNFFYHKIGSLRTIVKSDLISDIVIPYDKVLESAGNARFIHASLKSVTTDQVLFTRVNDNKLNDTVESLGFDFLVLAMGSSYVHPFNASTYDRVNQLELIKNNYDKFNDSKKILIVGGGPVGVEAAGEIATDAKDKSVTLITSSDKLLDAFSSPTLSRDVLSILKGKRVQVIFNDSVDLTNVGNFQSQQLKTKNGVDIEFDAYLQCFGSKPNTSAISADWLDDRSYIKVNKFFQVHNTDNIFAIGDCCDVKDMKLAYKAGMHCPVVVDNIDKLLQNNKSQLKEYVVDTKIASIVSLGRGNGVMKFGSFELSGCLPTMFKSKHLFVSKYRSMLRY